MGYIVEKEALFRKGEKMSHWQQNGVLDETNDKHVHNVSLDQNYVEICHPCAMKSAQLIYLKTKSKIPESECAKSREESQKH